MAKLYGDDLRRKFLLAYDQGEETLEELADRFLVSVGWAKKISAQRKRSGHAERVPHQPGRKWRADAGTQRQVIEWVASHRHGYFPGIRRTSAVPGTEARRRGGDG